MKIKDQFTVENISEFNKLLYTICQTEKCFYADSFWSFIDPYGFRYASLFSDEVHLFKQRGTYSSYKS